MDVLQIGQQGGHGPCLYASGKRIVLVANDTPSSAEIFSISLQQPDTGTFSFTTQTQSGGAYTHAWIQNSDMPDAGYASFLTKW